MLGLQTTSVRATSFEPYAFWLTLIATLSRAAPVRQKQFLVPPYNQFVLGLGRNCLDSEGTWPPSLRAKNMDLSVCLPSPLLPSFLSNSAGTSLHRLQVLAPFSALPQQTARPMCSLQASQRLLVKLSSKEAPTRGWLQATGRSRIPLLCPHTAPNFPGPHPLCLVAPPRTAIS